MNPSQATLDNVDAHVDTDDNVGPIARATLTGTGLTRPPSSRIRSLQRTGVSRPGTAMLARTASVPSPETRTALAPVNKAVAAARNFTGKSSILRREV